MDIGVFVPSGNNGWLISTGSPQYDASFGLIREMATIAEDGGLEFLLTPVKYRGFGGDTEHWDRNLEPITLMAGVAAVTSRIKLFSSVAILTIHPAIAARMAVTVDDIAPGRFGLNIVTGWQPGEYAQMGLWPGDEHFARRYDQASEYVSVMRELWATGQSTFDGEFYTLDDCRLGPQPAGGDLDIVCAGASERGMRFCAEHGDYQFITAEGINEPIRHAHLNERLVEASERSGRDVGAYPLFMIVSAETEQEARGNWERYNRDVDVTALSFMIDEASATKNSDSSQVRMVLPEGAVNLNIGTLVGSYEQIAAYLDEAASVQGTAGLMVCFDDPIKGLRDFTEKIQPLMESRKARIA